MRVLHFINSFGRGGTETQLLSTLPFLSISRWEHFVAALRPPTILQARFTEQGFPTHLLLPKRSHTMHDFIRGMAQLLRLVRQVRPQLIHTALFPSNLCARLVGHLTGTPVIEHLTNILHNNMNLSCHTFCSTKFAIERQLNRATCRYVRVFIAVSQAVKESATKVFSISEKKIVVIHRGLLPEDWSISGIQNREPGLISTVGRLVPVKGHMFLISAMKEVIKAFPQSRLVVIGDGPLRPQLEKLIEQYGLSRNIFLLGEKEQSEVKRILWKCGLFAFPSFSEGFPNSLLEAMAANVPLVATCLPSVLEIIGHHKVGLLVPPQNSQEMAKALCRLLSCPPSERWEMGTQGRQLVEENFDLRKIAPKWLQVYEEVIVSASSGGEGEWPK